MWDGGLQVTLGGMRLYGTDVNGCEWLVNRLDGIWDGTGSTHSHSSMAWSDGWFANKSWRNGRKPVVGGYLTCPDGQSFAASRQALLTTIGLDDFDMLVDAWGVKRLYHVRQDSGEPQISPAGKNTWKFSIPLVSLSPYAFDAGDPLSGSTGLPSSSGGLRLPAAFTGLPSSARSSWEGDAVWSSSLLDVGGVTVRNWMQDPRPRYGTRFEARWSGGLSVGADGLHVTPGAHRIGWNWTANPDHALASSPPAGAVLLPAGSYVVSWQWRLNQATTSQATAHVESSDGAVSYTHLTLPTNREV